MNKLIATVASITIAILLTGAVLVPVINQATSDEDKLEVYLLAGQSNIWNGYSPIVDLSPPSTEEVESPATNCYYYGTSEHPPWTVTANLSEYSIYPMYSDGVWTIGGEEPAIATAISHATNCDVLLINVAVPGQTINYFTPGNTGGEYISKVLSDALSKIGADYEVIRGSWIWCQGESDRTTAVSDYVADFGKIRDYFISENFDICYMIQTVPNRSGNATTAQWECVAQYSNVIMASTAPATFTVANGELIEGNDLHWTQHGRNIVGADVGEKIAETLHEPYSMQNTIKSLLKTIPVLVLVGLMVGAVEMFIRIKAD